MTLVSFEFFPPRTPELETQFWASLRDLTQFNPRFVSLTYGAGGSTRERSHAILQQLQSMKEHIIAAHLTCVAASRVETDAVIESYRALGITHFVALRGDMPDGQPYKPHPEGYMSSIELVAALREKGARDISVSAYPEPHPDAANRNRDLDLLRQKCDAGAERAITQFCFDTDKILYLRDTIAAADIDIELTPGIMPTTNFPGVARMAAKCGATMPGWIRKRYEKHISDKDACRAIAIEIAQEQCQHLLAADFTSLHFYTLNQANVVHRICADCNLGQRIHGLS